MILHTGICAYLYCSMIKYLSQLRIVAAVQLDACLHLYLHYPHVTDHIPL